MTPGQGWIAIVATTGALGGCVLAARATLAVDDEDASVWARHLLERYGLSWAVFAIALIALWRVPRRAALGLIVGGGIALQIVAIGVRPTTTDDYQRYVWDGIVASHGISPYRHAPLAPELAPLRTPALFPPDVVPDPSAAGDPSVTDICTSAGVPHDCTLINRPTVRTIYPPVAQAWFLVVHWLSPAELRVEGLQVAQGLLAIATTVALIGVLGRRERNPRWAAAWAWCPLVWWECGNNAHVEVLGVLFLVLALGARRTAVAGVLFGCAVGARLLPAVVGPALLGRRWKLFLATSIGVFVLGYLPHVAVVGAKVLGYIPGYLQEEGYDGTGRFGVLSPFVGSGSAATWLGATLLAALVVVIVIGARRRDPAVGALYLIGATLALIGPSQPWYALLVVALVALTGRWEWLGVALAGYFVYFAGNLGLDATTMQQRTYLPALILAVVATAVRWTRERRRTPERHAQPISISTS
ncbi:MAG: glycosyltransferase family 87 protein [Sporichthyaceae bacterium]